MESDAAGAMYVLTYDSTECVLNKLVPSGPGASTTAYSYPIGPASCNAMVVTPGGDVFVGRTSFTNDTYVQMFSDAAGFPQSTRLVNLWHMSNVQKLRVD